MTTHDLIAKFEALAEAPGGVVRLRDLILQLAVRGRLVTQDKSDEPGSDLVKKLPTNGLQGKEGGAAEATAAHWEIPPSWCWVRLSRIVNFSIGRTPPTKDSSYWTDEGGYPWVSIADMQHYGDVVATKRHVSDKAATEVFRKPPVPKGTILMSFKLTIGKVARLAVDAYHNEAIISVFPALAEMDDYLFRFLPLFASTVESNAAIKGQTLNSTMLANLLVPVPPLAEQHRIVARVRELLNLLDRLEASRAAREATRASVRDSALAALRDAEAAEEVEVAWNRFALRIDDLLIAPCDLAPLRHTVLELAVQGKLVPQDPADEPAKALLDRMAVEKAGGVSLKGSRGSKRLPSVADAHLPFSLPIAWCWARIADVTSSLDYGSSAKSHDSGKVPVLRMGNLQGGEIDWTDLKFTDDAAEIASYNLSPDTVLFNRTNSPALVGKTAIYRGNRPAIFAGYLIRLSLLSGVSPQYVNIWMNSSYARAWCWRSKQDGVSQSNISAQKLSALYLPLPPLAEQHRVVSRVEVLLRLLNRLDKQVASVQTTHAAFAAAAVHHLDA